jgi:3-hydroxybutyryl-CoA dehydrogenase
MSERVAVAGSGAIASGLAAVVAAQLGEVTLLARSPESAQRATRTIAKHLEKLERPDATVDCTTDAAQLKGATVVVEAIAEDHDHKVALLKTLAEHVDDDAIVCTTTSSLSVTRLAEETGRRTRFAGLHVFNPVPRMKLIELVVPEGADPDVRDRLKALCEALDKVAVETPDTPGFVVNALLFPYLFHAVRLKDETGLDAEGVDTCMKLGAGMPMGPLALLDFVGLDVSIAIAEQIGVDVPATVREMADAGKLGKKSGEGFYTYEQRPKAAVA